MDAMRRYNTVFLEYAALAMFGIMLIIAPYSRKLTKVLFILGFVCWLLLALIQYKGRWYRLIFPDNPLNTPILFFLIVCSLTIFFSLNPYHSQKVFVNRYPIYLVAFWTGVSVFFRSRKNMYVFVIALLTSSLLLANGMVRDYILLGPVRIFTAYGREIPFSMLPLFVTYVIPFTFAIYIFTRNKALKVFGLINLILLFPCLIWTGSRAAWSAVPISLFLISFFKNKKLVFKVLTVVVLSFAVGFLFSGIRQKIQSMPYVSQWNYRDPLFNSALSMFRDRPLMGMGFGMYEQMIKTPKYDLPADYPNRDHSLYLHAHNLYFEIMAEMGILGLLSFVLIFVVYFVSFAKQTKVVDQTDVSAA